jgi:hypothetical protein
MDEAQTRVQANTSMQTRLTIPASVEKPAARQITVLL